MQSVLGIDAAWTVTQPSGLALVTGTYKDWRLLAVESSYQRFRLLPTKISERRNAPLDHYQMLRRCLRLAQEFLVNQALISLLFRVPAYRPPRLS